VQLLKVFVVIAPLMVAVGHIAVEVNAIVSRPEPELVTLLVTLQLFQTL